MDCRITYVGTATFLLEIGGLRLLTDPVLDPAGSRETLRVRLLGRLGLDFPLVKLTGPALSTDELPELDAVLLSHDEHYDNLDAEGRALLRLHGPRVLDWPNSWEPGRSCRPTTTAGPISPSRDAPQSRP